MKRQLNAVLASLLTILCGQSSFAAPVMLEDNKYSKLLQLPIYEWVDNTKPRRGTIVAVHGLTFYGLAWNSMAKHLAANGYHVFSIDQRGFGKWRTQAGKYQGTAKIEIGQSQQDLLDLVTDLRQAHPDYKLFFLGESLGSNMALLLAEQHPELSDGAILGSPCYKARIHPKPLRWAEDFAKEMVRPNKPLNLEPYAAPYLTNDQALAKLVDSDPMVNRKMTPAELVKVDVMDDRAINGAKDLHADYPILIIAGADDAMFKSVDLPKEVQKWGTKNATVTLLPGRGHLLMEHQHVNPQISLLIDSWLAHHTPSVTLATAPGQLSPAAKPTPSNKRTRKQKNRDHG